MRGGAEVQATVDAKRTFRGRGCVPLDEIAAGYPAHLPQARRDDPRACGTHVPWADVVRDLDNLVEMEVLIGGKGYVFRGQASGVAGKVFQACGVALPPALRAC